MRVDRLRGQVRNVVEGGWVNDIPVQGFEGVRLKVRGTRCPDADRIREQAMADLPEDRRSDPAPADRDAIALAVMVDAILIDWDLEDENGLIPCTREARTQMLTDVLLGAPFRQAVAYASSVVAQRGASSLETDAKN